MTPIAVRLGVILIAEIAGCATPYVSKPDPVAREAAETPIRDRYARARIDLLEAINADRAATGAAPVGIDSLASVVAQGHAEAMAWSGFFSHYGVAGEAPFERLAEAGGTAHVRENIFRFEERFTGPREAGDAWDRFDVVEAERWLMGSPGHRATIVDPARTAVGIGIAVSPDGRRVFVVQEFVARHATIAVDRATWHRAPSRIEGGVLADGLRPLLVVLHRLDGPPDWVARGEPPPEGSYIDGGGAAMVLPPWAIEWRPGDRSFVLALPPAGDAGRRRYGILYVASERVVERAIAARSVDTSAGWPAAAFVLDAL